MPRTLLIGCGNPLRGDDGAGPAAAKLLARDPRREARIVHQLTPELAEDIARFDRVVFLDADVSCKVDALCKDAARKCVTIEPAAAALAGPRLSHAASPAEIVALARALFGFTGEALLCRIPARDFAGNAPGPDAAFFIQQAIGELEKIL